MNNCFSPSFKVLQIPFPHLTGSREKLKCSFCGCLNINGRHSTFEIQHKDQFSYGVRLQDNAFVYYRSDGSLRQFEGITYDWGPTYKLGDKLSCHVRSHSKCSTTVAFYKNKIEIGSTYFSDTFPSCQFLTFINSMEEGSVDDLPMVKEKNSKILKEAGLLYRRSIQKAIGDRHVSDEVLQKAADRARLEVLEFVKENKDLNLWEECEKLMQEEKDIFLKNKLILEIANAQRKVASCKKQIMEPRYYDPSKVFIVTGKSAYLGQGGCGKVFLAFDYSLTAVALKFRNTPINVHDDLFKLQKEIRMLTIAKHPHVICVYGQTIHDGKYAIVMEYMPGGSLASMIHNTSINVSPPVMLKFCSDVACGLSFLHHHCNSDPDIVHGDIKPENVLLSKDGTCKLIDFGGAVFVDQSGQPTTCYDGGAFTQYFAAPEKLKNSGASPTRRTDVYSFGMLVFTFVVRQYPLIDGTKQSHLQAIKDGRRPDMNDIKDLLDTLRDERHIEIVTLLRDVITECWKQNPDDRPTMKEVHQRLSDKVVHLEHVDMEAEEVVKKQVDPLVPRFNNFSTCPLDQYQHGKN
ncbi:uncharacterized protein LOC143461095 [Clavelina lepadiformis]|uniref:uncharacterized protein LOC143461095 n=1 Tax=Clavelina lepadiformis TaxID=159417 RepID=UPI004042D888